MLKLKLAALAASTILAIIPATSIAQNVPSFRVPIGGNSSASDLPDAYAWLETIGNCSTTCGTGTRITSYQCHNVADYDFSGDGYGVAEPDSMCTSSVGPRPASTTASCTVYSGCGYQWVRPPVTQTPIPLESNPVGRVGCGFINQKFSPYCQRTGGASTVILAQSDHKFCSSDLPSYSQVAAGNPDALGYDRDVTQVNVCNTTDHEWRTTSWNAWSSTCDTTAVSTRTVTCYRRFDNSVQPDTACNASTRPASSRTEAQYGSCSYSYSYGNWSGWSSGCDTNATRTRTATCMRSNNGGQAVAESECTSRSIIKQTISETSAQYGSCTYAFQTAAWGGWSSGCDTNATRSRDVWCQRSNGDRVADSECTNRSQAKPATSETSAQYGSCSYSWNTGSWGGWSSGCSNGATRTRSVTCTRSNNGGQAVADSECTNRGIGRPASSETAGQYGSCSYSAGGTPSAWSGWSSGCSTSATRSRTYQCIRSNDGGQAVNNAECTNRSVNLIETETAAQYGSCTHNWAAGGWSAWNSGCSNNATSTRSVWCRRDLDGATVSDGLCNAGARPASSQTSGQYGSCSYAAGGTPSAWSGWSSGCSTNATRSRTYQCVRSNDGGQVVGNAECTNRSINLTETETAAQYSSCSHNWATGGWSDWNSGCSNNATSTRAVWCRRDLDGATVTDGLCNAGTRPASSQTSGQYASCGYSAGGTPSGWSGWSSGCSTSATRSRTYQCIRSNDGGQVVGNAECTNRSVNLTETETSAQYGSCSHNWATGGWSAWNSGCSNNATSTRSVWCRRDLDGATVSDTLCNATARPASSQTSGQYASCNYSAGGTPSGWSGWNSTCSSNASRSRTYQCVRNNDGGQIVANAECTNRGVNLTETQTQAVYDNCSHNWATGGWGGWSSGCSASATRTRAVWCRRDADGATVSDGYCNGGTRPASSEASQQYGSCSYGRGAYQGASGWSSTCSSSAQRTHYYNCNRSDGAVVGSDECTNRGVSVSDVETAGNYSGCGYEAVSDDLTTIIVAHALISAAT